MARQQRLAAVKDRAASFAAIAITVRGTRVTVAKLTTQRDAGCRTASYDGCVANAGHIYGPGSDCKPCKFEYVVNSGCDSPSYCPNKYSEALVCSMSLKVAA